MKYTVFGVEEVYDAFDVYEHSNALAPVVIEAQSIEAAKSAGASALWDDIQKIRSGFLSSGAFAPLVTQIVDYNGCVVYDDRERMLRGWPFASDERDLGELASSSTLARMACFISYSSKDIDFATSLFKELLQQHILCWYASRRPEMRSTERIEHKILQARLAEAIGSVRVVLIVISDHSVKSDWVHFEVSRALEHHRSAMRPKLVGLKIGDSDVTPEWIPPLVESYPIWDFVNWRESPMFCHQIKRLAKQVASMFEVPST